MATIASISSTTSVAFSSVHRDKKIAVQEEHNFSQLPLPPPQPLKASSNPLKKPTKFKHPTKAAVQRDKQKFQIAFNEVLEGKDPIEIIKKAQQKRASKNQKATLQKILARKTVLKSKGEGLKKLPEVSLKDFLADLKIETYQLKGSKANEVQQGIKHINPFKDVDITVICPDFEQRFIAYLRKKTGTTPIDLSDKSLLAAFCKQKKIDGGMVYQLRTELGSLPIDITVQEKLCTLGDSVNSSIYVNIDKEEVIVGSSFPLSLRDRLVENHSNYLFKGIKQGLWRANINAKKFRDCNKPFYLLQSQILKEFYNSSDVATKEQFFRFLKYGEKQAEALAKKSFKQHQELFNERFPLIPLKELNTLLIKLKQTDSELLLLLGELIQHYTSNKKDDSVDCVLLRSIKNYLSGDFTKAAEYIGEAFGQKPSHKKVTAFYDILFEASPPEIKAKLLLTQLKIFPDSQKLLNECLCVPFHGEDRTALLKMLFDKILPLQGENVRPLATQLIDQVLHDESEGEDKEYAQKLWLYFLPQTIKLKHQAIEKWLKVYPTDAETIPLIQEFLQAGAKNALMVKVEDWLDILSKNTIEAKKYFEWQKRITEAQKILKHDADNITLQLFAGIALFNIKQHAEAFSYLQKIETLLVSDSKVSLQSSWLIEMYVDLAKLYKHFKEEEKQFNCYLKLFAEIEKQPQVEDDLKPEYQQARLLALKLGRSEELASALFYWSEYDSKNADAHIACYHVCLTLKQTQKAFEYLRKATEYDYAVIRKSVVEVMDSDLETLTESIGILAELLKGKNPYVEYLMLGVNLLMSEKIKNIPVKELLQDLLAFTKTPSLHLLQCLFKEDKDVTGLSEFFRRSFILEDHFSLFLEMFPVVFGLFDEKGVKGREEVRAILLSRLDNKKNNLKYLKDIVPGVRRALPVEGFHADHLKQNKIAWKMILTALTNLGGWLEERTWVVDSKNFSLTAKTYIDTTLAAYSLHTLLPKDEGKKAFLKRAQDIKQTLAVGVHCSSVIKQDGQKRGTPAQISLYLLNALFPEDEKNIQHSDIQRCCAILAVLQDNIEINVSTKWLLTHSVFLLGHCLRLLGVEDASLKKLLEEQKKKIIENKWEQAFFSGGMVWINFLAEKYPQQTRRAAALLLTLNNLFQKYQVDLTAFSANVKFLREVKKHYMALSQHKFREHVEYGKYFDERIRDLEKQEALKAQQTS